MNINEFAKLLDGRDIDNEITNKEIDQAKALGFVVIFGYSDDNAELRGAIDDEVGCFNGGEMYIDKIGLLEECDDDCKYYKLAKEKSKYIEICWDESEGEYAWTYDTEIPHATFEIMDEEDNKWCRGIVFDINNLG